MNAETSFEHRLIGLRQAATRCEHGTRARYVAGCRCLPCRAANARYSGARERACRAGDTRGLVSAEAARRHIQKLSRQGIGYKSVADAAGISRTILLKIKLGRRTQIRQDAERRILAVDGAAVADRALVPAAHTWKLLNELIGAGYTRTWLAARLGSKAKVPALQLQRDFVTAANASRVERLYRLIHAGKVQR